MLERVGPYRIEGELGRGGMGVVYRATDSRLGRLVAIKALPEHLADDAERLARFEAEARALAALNHPNVGGIHGVEEQDGQLYLVLEFVDGETLADLLERERLALDQVLDIAIRIAAGLSAAHDAGIVHRDLKPANVKITPGDEVKVLDFGLAKTAVRAGSSDTGLESSPTMTQATQAGMILGTAGYMSPEQARGKPVDKRSDVFSFGCVLFEMLGGVQPFGGETVTDALGAVLHREPDWSQLPAGVPPRLRLLLERCLSKDRDQRLHDIADARLELQDVRAGKADPAPVAADEATRRWWPYLVAFAAGAALTALAFWQGGDGPPAPPHTPKRFELSGIRMPMDAFQSIVLSPDGTKLVVRALGDDDVESLEVRSFDSFELESLPGTEAGRLPFFSPAGDEIAFFSLGELKVISLSGGITRTIATTDQGFSGGVWLPDGTILFTGVARSNLYRVSADGGSVETVPIEGLDEGNMLTSPSRLPGDEAILLSVRRGETFDVAVYTLTDGKLQFIADGGFTPTWSPTGHVLYHEGRSGPLMSLPFDPRRRVATGRPFPVLNDLGTRVSAQVRMFAVAGDGTLAFIPRSRTPDRSTFVWVDAEGRETPITTIDRVADLPRLSHDGTRIAFRAPAPNCDVWVHDLTRGNTTRISREGDNHGVAWSPDDRRIASMRQVEPGLWSVVTMASDGAGEAQRASPPVIRDGFASAYSPDGTMVLTGSLSGDTTADIQIVTLADGTVRPLFESRFDEHGARISPDGDFVAYTSNESGREEIYVQPFPGLDARMQVSTAGGAEPVWSRDGSRLFFRWGRKLLAADVRTAPVFSVGVPAVVLEGDFAKGNFGLAGYDVAPDGRRFVMVRERFDGGVADVKIILDWFSELEALMDED